MKLFLFWQKAFLGGILLFNIDRRVPDSQLGVVDCTHEKQTHVFVPGSLEIFSVLPLVRTEKCDNSWDFPKCQPNTLNNFWEIKCAWHFPDSMNISIC